MPKQKQNRKPGIHLHKTVERVTKLGTDLNEYYWILIAKNGKTIARSSETYKTKRSAVRSIKIAERHFLFNNHYYDHSMKTTERVVY